MAIKRTRNSGLTVPELVKPTQGGSQDVWGGYLNSNIDKQSEFYTKLVQDSETQNQEITRLDREKVSTSDVPTIVEPIVDQFLETNGKPMLDEYVEETIKPSIDTYTSGKKSELDNYVNLTSKPSLDSYEKEKEAELDNHTETKKQEITSHTDSEILRIQGEGTVQVGKVVEEGDNQVKRVIEAGEGLTPRVEALEEGKLDKGGYNGTALDLKNLIDSKPNTEVVAGQGLKSSQVENTVTVSIESADEGILVNENNIQLNVVNDFVTGGIKRPLSAEQGKVLKQLIDTLGGGGTTSLLRQARVLGDADYIGSLSASAVDIVVGSKLNKPTLYLDGTRMDSTTYSVELNLGKITLNEAYADYDVTWVVEDEFPSHIRFSYPTLSLLQADEQIKSIINVGDVIEILGESDVDDGGQRLVKCSNELGLNGVDIGDGKYLNEIPNSKPSDKVDKSDIVDNLTTADKSKVLSANMGKYLENNKQNKTDSGLQTDSKEIVGAINESLWHIRYKTLSTVNDFNELTQSGVFYGRAEVGTLNSPYTPPFNFILINYNKSGLVEQTVITGVDDIVMRRRVSTSWRNWEKTLRTNTKEFLGNAGISSIIYIQDEGQKTAGNGYVDKTTGKLYLCKTTTSDTSVTTNFVLATNIENAKGTDVVKLRTSLTSSNDLDGMIDTGYYQWYVENGYPSNMPTGHGTRGLLLIIRSSSHIFQQITDSNNNIFSRFKVGSAWSSWVKYTTTTV